ncbi:ABC transporter substrate-binding protein [Bradyrhizobium betae]
MFGITAAFAEKNPNTVLALTKALIRAAMWLDENANANRTKAVELLSKPEYVGADKAVIANSMTGVRSNTRRATSVRSRTSTCSSAISPPIPTSPTPSGI